MQLFSRVSRSVAVATYLAGQTRHRPSFSEPSQLFTNRKQWMIPSLREDGLGIQAIHRVGVRALCLKSGAEYLHLPFKELAHWKADSNGRLMGKSGWAREWELILNLGSSSPQIGDLAKAIGLYPSWKLLRKCYREEPIAVAIGDHQLQLQPIPWLNSRLEALHSSGFPETLLTELRSSIRFRTPSRVQNLFSPSILNIAIHIRRGDVQEFAAGQRGTHDVGYSVRYLDEQYYCDLLCEFSIFLKKLGKECQFHIFTDGCRSDFPRFTFTGNASADLLESGNTIAKDVHFHFDLTAFETLEAMVKADVFVPTKSAFSALAVMYRTNPVVFDDHVFELGAFNFLKQTMSANKRYCRRSNLGGLCDLLVR